MWILYIFSVTVTAYMQVLSLFLPCLFTVFPIMQVTSLLNRMQLCAKQSVSGDSNYSIAVSVPPTRNDVLHPCDVMEVLIVLKLGHLLDASFSYQKCSECHTCICIDKTCFLIAKDVAIAYGYNNVKDITIDKGYNISKGRAVSLKPLRLEEFSHLIRLEVRSRLKNLDCRGFFLISATVPYIVFCLIIMC